MFNRSLKTTKTVKIINPLSLKPAEQIDLVDSLYKLHEKIFKGVNKEGFAKYVVYSKADFTEIFILKTQEDLPFGYCVIHRFDKIIEGEKVAIFRAEAGLLKEYRGKCQLMSYFIKEEMKYKLKHLKEKVYYLGTFVHPSVFHVAAKYCWKMYPDISTKLDQSQQQIMYSIAHAFDIYPSDPTHPLMTKVGWITKDDEKQTDYWQHCNEQGVKYFITQNPTYNAGTGLLILVPITISNAIFTTFNYLCRKFYKFLNVDWFLHSHSHSHG